MEEYPKIAFIGAGNMANSLAPALENIGFPVREVYSRTAENARELSRKLYECDVRGSLDFSNSVCSVFFLTVPDDALEEIATEIVLPDPAMVVHTSGTQPLSILGYLATEHIGVFYPLQTFSKGKSADFRHIPIFIEAETDQISSLLIRMGKGLSDTVNKLHTPDRRIMHLAAVFASNFPTHLFTIAADILERRGLEFEHLHPLISETVNKSIRLGPKNSQTGPAIRKDYNVIRQHLQALSGEEELERIYSLLTDHILETYHRES